MKFLTLSKFVTIGACLLLVGCSKVSLYPNATYQQAPTGLASIKSGGGYKDKKIGENKYKIRYIPDNSAKNTNLSDFLLLRAAEVSKMNGADFFEILESKRKVVTGGYYGLGNTVLEGIMEIKLLQHGSINNRSHVFYDQEFLSHTKGRVYDANIVLNTLKTRYGIN